MITIKGLATRAPSGTWADPHSDIIADPGQTVSIVGPSGSGKTALCLAICGLAERIEVRGGVFLDGRDVTTLSDEERATMIAYVPTDPSLLFSGIKSTLRGEFELAWQLLSPICDFSFEHISQAASIFRIEHLLDQNPFTFSGGEATRAAIALALAKLPRLVAIDQGYEGLDPDAAIEIRRAIARLLPKAAIVFETFSRRPFWIEDHHSDKLDPLAAPDPTPSKAWRIYSQARNSDCIRRMDASRLDNPRAQDIDKSVATCSARTNELLRVSGLEFRYKQSSFELGPLELSVGAGERIALRGPNGIGKTTLLKCLALLLPARYRTLEVITSDGNSITPPEPSQIHKWAGIARYCFQNPDDQIYLPTVKEELSETAREGGGIDTNRVLEIAEHFGLTPFLDASPSELPRSYRRLVCIAAALSADAPILLLDEPSAFLDEEQTLRLTEALLTFCVPHSASIMVSHDGEFVTRTANRIIDMTVLLSRGHQATNPHLDPM